MVLRSHRSRVVTVKMLETSQSRWWFSLVAPEHPVWGIMKVLVVTACVALLLTFNATTFDSGEVQTVIGTFFATFLLEGVRSRKKVER